jgi:hypothetical protein
MSNSNTDAPSEPSLPSGPPVQDTSSFMVMISKSADPIVPVRPYRPQGTGTAERRSE